VHSPDMIMAACCFTIYACERVRDFDRSAQWCEKVKEFCLRYNLRSMLAFCRVHYAAVLVWRGQWAEADEELTAATRELTATRIGLATEGILRLGELRRRQGRLEEAARLFGEAPGDPFATLGRAGLALDSGDIQSASDLVERFLRQLPADDLLGRVDGLLLALRVRAALGRIDDARGALAQLEAAADGAAGTPPLQGMVAAGRGHLALAGGDPDAARRDFEDAVDCFQRCRAPYETARARVDLAEALLALGRREAAAAELRAALETFLWVGARPDAARATTLLEPLGGSRPSTGGASPLPAGLTRREAEVLGLLAKGMSNQEIAQDLFLSVRTVERHISTIYAKIDADGPAARAIAAAFAFSHGLAIGDRPPSVRSRLPADT
jgi:LuxR family maltose regulon positive regulatory protein